MPSAAPVASLFQVICLYWLQVLRRAPCRGPTIGEGEFMNVSIMQEAVEGILHIFTCVHKKAGTGCESNMVQSTEKLEKPKCALPCTIA